MADGGIVEPGSEPSCLASLAQGSSILVGCASFQGKHWTGSLSLVRVDPEDASPDVRCRVTTPAGVSALDPSPEYDPITEEYRVIVGTDAGSVSLWNVIPEHASVGLQEIVSRHWQSGPITSCPRLSDDRFVSCSLDGSATLWQVTPVGLTALHDCRPGCTSVNDGIVVTPPGQAPAVVLATSGQGGIVVWDPRQRDAARPCHLSLGGAEATALTPAPERESFLVGDAGGVVRTIGLDGSLRGPDATVNTGGEAVRRMVLDPANPRGPMFVIDWGGKLLRCGPGASPGVVLESQATGAAAWHRDALRLLTRDGVLHRVLA